MISGIPLFKVVSFFTPKYEEVSERLKGSLIKLGIPHHIQPVADTGDWVKNCAFKASFCFGMWESSEVPIVWVDADAVVRAYPVLFESITADVAVHFRNDRKYKNECLSGTIFFNKTEGALKILRNWAHLCKTRDNEWDQRILQDVLQTTENYSLYRLPASYTQIYDTMADRGPAIIEHFQKSREVR